MSFTKTVKSGASEERLERLIASRLAPGADKEKIDQRIWDLFGEEWCVMFTDLSGFSRGVAKFGIIHFLQTIYESERLLIPVIEDHDGILLKVEGDSFMVIFRNPKKALECSISMQRTLKAYNQSKADEEKVLLCVGLGHGKMLRIGDADVFGVEVNGASKLGEDRAGAWEILVTENVKKQTEGSKDIQFSPIEDPPSGVGTCYKVLYTL